MDLNELQVRWLREQVEAINESAVVVQIFNQSMVSDWESDFAPIIHIGAAVLLGKPLIILVRDNDEIPERLAAIADRVIRFDGENMAGIHTELGEAMNELTE